MVWCGSAVAACYLSLKSKRVVQCCVACRSLVWFKGFLRRAEELV